MKKRSVGFVLAGLLLAGGAPFAASGCGHSLEGDYMRLCKSTCTAGDDCENRTKVVVDLDKCNRDCEDNSDNFAANVQDECGANYEILGDKVDLCLSTLDRLASACRADDTSAISDATSDYLDNCATEKFYTCN